MSSDLTSYLYRKFKTVFFLCLLSLVSTQLQGVEGRLEADPVFGGKVYVYEAGNPDKPTLVLVHGLGSAASDDWAAVIKLLSPDYHLLTLDLPGFGRSSKRDQAYTPTNYAKLVHLLTRKHATRPFHLIGHSLGGAIALRYAASYPKDVKTLTLVAPAGILHRMAYAKFLTPLAVDHYAGYSVPARGAISDFAGKILEHTEQILPFDPSLVLQFAPMRQKVLQGNPTAVAGLELVQENFSQAPEQVVAPTLVVWGRDDDVAPLRTGYVLDALIHKSQLEVIDDAGHVPIKSHAEKFVKLLRPHLIGSTDPELYTKQRTVQGKQQTMRCSDSRGKRYTGRIAVLVLNDCQDILIADAEISRLVIHSSQVTIQNSSIRSNRVAIKVNNSSVIMTGGKVEGDIAISSYNSRFDIAGTTLIGNRAAIETQSKSKFIFSLGRINSPKWPDKTIHEYKVLTAGQTL